MNAWLVAHAGIMRFGVVAGIFLLVLLGQRLMPRRGEASTLGRRLRNIGMTLLSAGMIYLVLPLTAVGFAVAVADMHLGLFNLVEWPTAVKLAIGIIVLDLSIYWQHRWMHAVPWLWRIHRLHHSDTNFEVTLGLRFHPIEIFLSLLYKCFVIALLGAAPLTVLIYEILLAVFSLLSHADVALSPGWDKTLRRLVITPDWHRVHHSVHRAETDSNYGNFLSLWDRLFGSVIEQPRDGHGPMRIGLNRFRDSSGSLLAMLLQPFQQDRNHTDR